MKSCFIPLLFIAGSSFANELSVEYHFLNTDLNGKSSSDVAGAVKVNYQTPVATNFNVVISVQDSFSMSFFDESLDFKKADIAGQYNLSITDQFSLRPYIGVSHLFSNSKLLEDNKWGITYGFKGNYQINNWNVYLGLERFKVSDLDGDSFIVGIGYSF